MEFNKETAEKLSNKIKKIKRKCDFLVLMYKVISSAKTVDKRAVLCFKIFSEIPMFGFIINC